MLNLLFSDNAQDPGDVKIDKIQNTSFFVQFLPNLLLKD